MRCLQTYLESVLKLGPVPMKEGGGAELDIILS